MQRNFIAWLYNTIKYAQNKEFSFIWKSVLQLIDYFYHKSLEMLKVRFLALVFYPLHNMSKISCGTYVCTSWAKRGMVTTSLEHNAIRTFSAGLASQLYYLTAFVSL